MPAQLQLPYVNAKLLLQGGREEEVAWLRRLMPKRGGMAIDVGANIGIYSYHLSRICSRVEAFEPNPESLKILEAYGAPNVHTHCVALSAESGMAMLNIPMAGGLPQAGLASLESVGGQDCVSFEVPKRTLDSYEFNDIRFMKIDVEGHELDVLRGAERTIRANQPILLIEIEQRHQSIPIATVFEVILALGYRGFFVFDGLLQPLAQFDLGYHQLGYEAGTQPKKYVNNFFFLASRHTSQ